MPNPNVTANQIIYFIGEKLGIKEVPAELVHDVFGRVRDLDNQHIAENRKLLTRLLNARKFSHEVLIEYIKFLENADELEERIKSWQKQT